MRFALLEHRVKGASRCSFGKKQDKTLVVTWNCVQTFPNSYLAHFLSRNNLLWKNKTAFAMRVLFYVTVVIFNKSLQYFDFNINDKKKSFRRWERGPYFFFYSYYI